MLYIRYKKKNPLVSLLPLDIPLLSRIWLLSSGDLKNGEPAIKTIIAAFRTKLESVENRSSVLFCQNDWQIACW